MTLQLKKLTIHLAVGDILFQPSDALFCPCFSDVLHQNGLCRQILQISGSEAGSTFKKKSNSPIVFTTPSFRLAMRKIKNLIHLRRSENQSFEEVILSSLQLAVDNHWHSISFNSLEAQSNNLTPMKMAQILDRILRKFSLTTDEFTIQIIDANEKFIQQMKEFLQDVKR